MKRARSKSILTARDKDENPTTVSGGKAKKNSASTIVEAGIASTTPVDSEGVEEGVECGVGEAVGEDSSVRDSTEATHRSWNRKN